jgi:DNA repair and recombination protein RAD54 and RAD54-like protein
VNWADEFDKWLGKASQPKRVVLRNGGQEGLQQIRSYTSSMKMNLKHHVGQVLIVSYDLFRRNVEEFIFPEHTSIGLLVCDESHRLKSSTGSQTLSALESLHADARLCITATPIQNNLSEFFNLANFCCPGILGPDLATFRSTYDRPIAAANQKNATPSTKDTGQLKSKELETISKSFMLRRMQKDILRSMLSPRVEVLLFCRLSPTQTELYQRLTNQAVATLGMTEALQTLTSLRKICCHPKLLGSAECRPNDGLSGKVVVLTALLQELRKQAPHDKVVVVSNFTSALTVIEDCVLQPNKMGYLRLDGTSKDRQSMVDSFNRSKPEQCFCFLLSSKAGGCGLNLVGANRLVMFGTFVFLSWIPSAVHLTTLCSWSDRS